MKTYAKWGVGLLIVAFPLYLAAAGKLKSYAELL